LTFFIDYSQALEIKKKDKKAFFTKVYLIDAKGKNIRHLWLLTLNPSTTSPPPNRFLIWGRLGEGVYVIVLLHTFHPGHLLGAVRKVPNPLFGQPKVGEI